MILIASSIWLNASTVHLCVFVFVAYWFIEITIRHGCSPVNLLHIFRTPFPENTSGVMQLYWNHTSAWVFSCKFAAYFQNTFSWEHLWVTASQSGTLVENGLIMRYGNGSKYFLHFEVICFTNQKIKHFIAKEQNKWTFNSDNVSGSIQKWEWIISIRNHISGLLSILQREKSPVHTIAFIFLSFLWPR